MTENFVSSEVRTPAGRVREALFEIESALPRLRGTGRQALELLHLFDRVADALTELEEGGVDVRAERARFEGVQQRLRRKGAIFLAEAGAALQSERAQVGPDRERWWWFLDETLAQERRQRGRRALAWALAAALVLLTAWLAYDRFLAPPPEIDRAAEGEALVARGDLRAALAEFEASATLAPGDPDYLIWLGVLRFELGDLDEAENAFETARALCETDYDFLLKRAQDFFRVGNLEEASADVEQAILERPDAAGGYVLRASIAEERGDCASALADLERAMGLASAADDAWLEGEIRVRRAMLAQSCQPSTPTP